MEVEGIVDFNVCVAEGGQMLTGDGAQVTIAERDMVINRAGENHILTRDPFQIQRRFPGGDAIRFPPPRARPFPVSRCADPLTNRLDGARMRAEKSMGRRRP